MEDKSRSLYTHEEYISLVLNSGSGLSHDYVSQSIQEDPRMMAFFDSLVRREIEGWSSDSDSDLSEEAIMQLHAQGRRTAQATPAAATDVSVTGHHTDSDNSSSSSLAVPNATGGEAGAEAETQPMRHSHHQQHQSGFLANEDSDSSEFWLDPMPRPRSPSPRDNSTLSSPTSSNSLPVGVSSSSTSTSSSSSDDEERRSEVRRHNVMRRRRMHMLSRAEDRPESVQALFSAIDSCSYPSISIDELSTSSSGEDRRSLQIKPCSGRDEETCLSSSDFVCLSPEMSPENQNEDRSNSTEPERLPTVSPLAGHRTSRKSPTELVFDSSDSGEACSSSGALGTNSQSLCRWGANGQHRTVTPYVSENLLVSSELEEETDVIPEYTRSLGEKGLAQKLNPVGSEEDESNSEKKLKT